MVMVMVMRQIFLSFYFDEMKCSIVRMVLVILLFLSLESFDAAMVVMVISDGDLRWDQ
jgi:hypothetical protein